jgi:hypothetical protein
MNAIADPATGFARDEVEDLIEDASNGIDTLIVELVKVDEAHRGIGVGLMAAMRFVKTFGAGCGYAIGKAFPLQFASTDAPTLSPERTAAFRKLREHWSRIGFKRLGKNSDYMAINLDKLQPTADDALASYEQRKSAS